MINKQKICIGGSQFGDKIYGAASKREKKLNIKEIRNILIFCQKNKIKILDLVLDDTNSTYLNVNKKLIKTKLNMRNFNIILKVKLTKNILENEKIIERIKNLKKNFDIKKFYNIMIHNVKEFKKKDLKFIKIFFNKVKKNFLAKELGISIYSFKEYLLIKKEKIDINAIQMPYNFFDQENLSLKIKKILKKKNIKIFIRSIFLQGILLSNFNKLNKYFFKWRNQFRIYEEFLKINGKNKLSINVNFALNQNPSGIILGIDSLKQLKQILLIKRKKNIKTPKKIINISKKFIKPYNWPSEIYLK